MLEDSHPRLSVRPETPRFTQIVKLRETWLSPVWSRGSPSQPTVAICGNSTQVSQLQKRAKPSPLRAQSYSMPFLKAQK